MKRSSSIAALAVLFLAFALAGCGHHTNTAPLNNTSVEPSAQGKVVTSHDRNGNTVIKVRVAHVADPAQLTPSKAGYVVWEQPKGMPAKNLGQLKVNSELAGAFDTSTPDKNFDVFVTAEDNLKADSPSGPEILRSAVKSSD